MTTGVNTAVASGGNYWQKRVGSSGSAAPDNSERTLFVLCELGRAAIQRGAAAARRVLKLRAEIGIHRVLESACDVDARLSEIAVVPSVPGESYALLVKRADGMLYLQRSSTDINGLLRARATW